MKLRSTITHGGTNMDYQHLTTIERGRIEALHNLGYTVRK
jgi:IS30 family transposase